MTNTSIPIEGKKEGFGGFIDLLKNRRIFFSAPFGMGKTYFLKEFFEANKDKYTVFHLYPVKYQVRNDVEIVELIGADLFSKMMRQKDGVVKELLKDENIKRKFKHAARALTSLLGSLAGVNALGIFDTVKKLGGNTVLKEYEGAAAGMNSSFFEDLVREILQKANGDDSKEEGDKNKKNSGQKEGDEEDGGEKKEDEEGGGGQEKESVLILDDLDRLEPKHIFKILNSFSPLQDEEDNKFGFDKVIFVGDIDNIQKIFHHLYGKDTDFKGYIDKFFSVAPYRYDIRGELRGVIRQIIGTYSHNGSNIKHSLEGGGDIASVLFFVLVLAMQLRKINLRNVFMPQHILLSVINDDIQDERKLRNAKVYVSAKILLQLFQNSKESLLEAVKMTEEEVADMVQGFADQDILNLQQSGASMFLEKYIVENDLQHHVGGIGLSERINRSLEPYRTCFDFCGEGDKLRAAQEFLKFFRGYIEQGVYEEIHDVNISRCSNFFNTTG